jgi:hypothetical protein
MEQKGIGADAKNVDCRRKVVDGRSTVCHSQGANTHSSNKAADSDLSSVLNPLQLMCVLVCEAGSNGPAEPDIASAPNDVP